MLHCKCEVNEVGKRLLREDLVISLAYRNIRIGMTLKIPSSYRGRSLGLISIYIDLDHIFIQIL